MRQTIRLEIDAEFFQLEQAAEAESLARNLNSGVYTWKTIGRTNWLELGFANVDALGLVVLPASLSNTIRMCDDEEEEGVIFP